VVVALGSYTTFALASAVGGSLGRLGVVAVGGRRAEVWTARVELGRLGVLAETGDDEYWETVAKYVWGAAASKVYDARPDAVGIEVGNIGRYRKAKFVYSLAQALGVDLDTEVIKLYFGEETRFDLLGVDRRGRLVIVELKNMEREDKIKSELANDFPVKISQLVGLRDVLRGSGLREGEVLAMLVSAFNGAGVEGGRAASAFFYEPTWREFVPRLAGRLEDSEVVFSLVLFHPDGRFASFTVEVKLRDLMDRGFLEQFIKDAIAWFKSNGSWGGGLSLGDVVKEAAGQHPSEVIKLLFS